jgi:DNA-binding NarL/FixJ family response regulator
MSKVRVLIADDQVLFAGSLRVVLEGHGNDISVVGVAYDGQEAIDLVAAQQPDLVLMDVRMPRLDGVSAAREIRARFPRTKVVMLTTFDDDDYVRDALANGAVGYILKNIRPEDLVSVITAVANGALLPSPAARDLGRAAPAAGVRAAEVNFLLSRFPDLSRREAQVLTLVAENLDNHEIAAKLSIGEQTVRNYVSRIYTKLGVPDRLHAIQFVRASTRGDQGRPRP